MAVPANTAAQSCRAQSTDSESSVETGVWRPGRERLAEEVACACVSAVPIACTLARTYGSLALGGV